VTGRLLHACDLAANKQNTGNALGHPMLLLLLLLHECLFSFSPELLTHLRPAECVATEPAHPALRVSG
jgi:hypothetical protein